VRNSHEIQDRGDSMCTWYETHFIRKTWTFRCHWTESR